MQDFISVKAIGSAVNIQELQETTNSHVLKFRLAVNRRYFDKKADDWKDGVTTWKNVELWGKLAENTSKSLKSGDRVVVLGEELTKDNWTNKEGEEVQGQDFIKAVMVSHALDRDSAESHRKPKGKRDSDDAPEQKSSGLTKSKAKKEEPKAEKSDPLDDDFDLDDLNIDDLDDVDI